MRRTPVPPGSSPPAGTLGQGQYGRLKATLERYISPMMVSGILDRAMAAQRVTREKMTTASLHDVVEYSRVGFGALRRRRQVAGPHAGARVSCWTLPFA